MQKRTQIYTKEFKLEAVQLVQTSGKSQAQIARDLGVADSTLSHWCKQMTEHGSAALIEHLHISHTFASLNSTSVGLSLLSAITPILPFV